VSSRKNYDSHDQVHIPHNNAQFTPGYPSRKIKILQWCQRTQRNKVTEHDYKMYTSCEHRVNRYSRYL